MNSGTSILLVASQNIALGILDNPWQHENRRLLNPTMPVVESAAKTALELVGRMDWELDSPNWPLGDTLLEMLIINIYLELSRISYRISIAKLTDE